MMTKQDFIDVVDTVLRPMIKDQIKDEVKLQVHNQAMNLLTSEAGSIIRDAVEKEVKRRVQVDIRIAPWTKG